MIPRWQRSKPSQAVQRYIGAYLGEFDTGGLCCQLPYRGAVSGLICGRKDGTDQRGAFHRFSTLRPWTVYWEPRRQGIINNFTADLLHTASCLGGRLCYEGSPAGPGGIHAEGNDLWIGFEDGGVGVEVSVVEHHNTNRLSASQRTTIRGAHVLRLVTRAMGFDHIPRKLTGEAVAPSAQSMDDEVRARLRLPPG